MNNPFEVLRLDPSASDEEVVRQGGRLRRRADAEELVAVRQAVQALTADAEDRLLHQLLTHARPCYRWPALERFAAAFRRPPTAGGM